MAKRPLREDGLRIAASKIFEKHPTKTFVDVGANIGDTAAIVRSVSACDMVLIEPSDQFFPLLAANALQFGPGVTWIQSFFVSPTHTDSTFSLIHSAGTANRTTKGSVSLTRSKRTSNSLSYRLISDC